MNEKQTIKIDLPLAEIVTMEIKDYFNERLKFEKALKALHDTETPK
jgi:hypothetical protein